MDGIVQNFNTRLVEKGITQTQGVDYDQTFSTVVKINSIRVMLSISSYHEYEVWKTDVKIASLNEKLTEDVYMDQPEDFEQPKFPNKLCKLEKSIYGLKQPYRSWNLYFHEKVEEFNKSI